MFKKFVICACLLALFACSTPKQEQSVTAQQAQKKAQRIIVVSSGTPAKVLPAFTTFAWSDDYSYILSSSINKNKSEIKTYLEKEIIKYLATKGYTYEADIEKADVVVGFLYALEDDMADPQIESKFGLLPRLNSDAVDNIRYEKGSLLLLILNQSLQKVYWRSAIQGFVDLNGSMDMSKNQRMQWILDLMMGRFPIAGR